MSHQQIIDDILRGGLPALLDGGTTTPVVDPQRVEEISPEPQLKDRETFLMGADVSRNILFGTAGIIAVLAIILIARR